LLFVDIVAKTLRLHKTDIGNYLDFEFTRLVYFKIAPKPGKGSNEAKGRKTKKVVLAVAGVSNTPTK
jgi:hypothetical protein